MIVPKEKASASASIGERIRILRTLKQIERTHFASKCGFSPQQLSKIETGARGISIPTLVNIARVLNTSTDYLVGLTDMPVSPDDPIVREVLSILRGQKDDNKAVMLSTLRSLDKSLP